MLSVNMLLVVLALVVATVVTDEVVLGIALGHAKEDLTTTCCVFIMADIQNVCSSGSTIGTTTHIVIGRP